MIEPIAPSELKSINKASEIVHRAAQYIAMAGKYFSEPQDDDGHLNLGWLVMKEKFITHPLGVKKDRYMMLHPETMTIGFLDSENHLLSALKLKGKDEKEIKSWIKDHIKKYELGKTKYQINYHYDVPFYISESPGKFKKSPKKGLAGFSKLRTWGEHFIHLHKLNFPYAQETRTWPHHFDHAAYIPLNKLKSGETTKSLTLGLAIHDGMINEPYFYVSAWSKNKEVDVSEFAEMPYGYWLNEGYKGAALPIFDILDLPTLEMQEKAINTFFSDAISALTKHIQYRKPDAVSK